MDSGTERMGVCNIGKCRVGQSVSECAILVTEQYIQRQDTVCVEMHFNMCGVMGEILKQTVLCPCAVIGKVSLLSF
jgi:hypothetical protein